MNFLTFLKSIMVFEYFSSSEKNRAHTFFILVRNVSIFCAYAARAWPGSVGKFFFFQQGLAIIFRFDLERLYSNSYTASSMDFGLL